MSKMPKVSDKPKYNNNDAFRWVDMQWERFMMEQKEICNSFILTSFLFDQILQ